MLRLIWGKFRDATSLITLLGCILILGIIFSGANTMIVLLVLGALDFYMGLYSFIEKKIPMRRNYSNVKDQVAYCENLGKVMMAIGVYIFLMAAVYFLKILSLKYFWDIFLVGLLVLLVIGFFFHKREKAS